MISTPTVLILGAGASKPYDFPTGRELLLEIVHGLDQPDVRLNPKLKRHLFGLDRVGDCQIAQPVEVLTFARGGDALDEVLHPINAVDDELATNRTRDRGRSRDDVVRRGIGFLDHRGREYGVADRFSGSEMALFAVVEGEDDILIDLLLIERFDENRLAH